MPGGGGACSPFQKSDRRGLASPAPKSEYVFNDQYHPVFVFFRPAAECPLLLVWCLNHMQGFLVKLFWDFRPNQGPARVDLRALRNTAISMICPKYSINNNESNWVQIP